MAFVLCQLPSRPLEKEGGERRQQDLKALGWFSLMSFLSNTPTKAAPEMGLW